jgi:hypothetical protein
MAKASPWAPFDAAGRPARPVRAADLQRSPTNDHPATHTFDGPLTLTDDRMLSQPRRTDDPHCRPAAGRAGGTGRRRCASPRPEADRRAGIDRLQRADPPAMAASLRAQAVPSHRWINARAWPTNTRPTACRARPVPRRPASVPRDRTVGRPSRSPRPSGCPSATREPDRPRRRDRPPRRPRDVVVGRHAGDLQGPSSSPCLSIERRRAFAPPRRSASPPPTSRPV